jgi:hypothetical protein
VALIGRHGGTAGLLRTDTRFLPSPEPGARPASTHQ